VADSDSPAAVGRRSRRNEALGEKKEAEEGAKAPELAR